MNISQKLLSSFLVIVCVATSTTNKAMQLLITNEAGSARFVSDHTIIDRNSSEEDPLGNMVKVQEYVIRKNNEKPLNPRDRMLVSRAAQIITIESMSNSLSYSIINSGSCFIKNSTVEGAELLDYGWQNNQSLLKSLFLQARSSNENSTYNPNQPDGKFAGLNMEQRQRLNDHQTNRTLHISSTVFSDPTERKAPHPDTIARQ